MSTSRAAKEAERAERLAKFSNAPAPRITPEDDERGPGGDPSAGRASAPAKKKRTRFRTGIDLYPAQHRQLVTWCTDAAFELGTSSVAQQHVFETLVKLLVTDETLSRKVKDELRKRLEEKW